jgi:uncharacterized protein YeaO (DUF488 family)
MRIKAKRWNDLVERDDGCRVLICRYRPRGVPKKDETWNVWYPELGPSRALHADYYGKLGPPIRWSEYKRRYLSEIRRESARVAELARRAKNGDTITLLCSSACVDPERCHRTLLRRRIEQIGETPTFNERRRRPASRVSPPSGRARTEAR